MRPLLTGLFVCLLFCFAPSARATPLELQPPVQGRAVEAFHVSGTRYSAGHRGVDLASSPGQEVRASAAGLVFFAGIVAGRPTVSVDHGGGVRTTYTPTEPSVSTGDTVETGQVIGTVGVDAHCRSACVHWGLTDGIDHFDPTAHLSVPAIRLLPLGSAPRPPARLASITTAGRMPVPGPTTSPFGMRKHPITGIRKLHDGTDIGAPCGTPVVSPRAGRVVGAVFHSAYGFRVILEHDGLRTAYAHLRGLEVRRGDEVAAGARLGAVGSTGMSTGCHLHWMAWRNGTLIDPLTITT